MQKKENEEWDLVIQPKVNLFQINFREIWEYRDLMAIFIKRDIVTLYQQTILGPIWYFFQPLVTSVTFFVVFSKIAHISTNKTPEMLFYLSGLAIWNYFTACFTGASGTFGSNAGLFGKVYFPRLVSPISAIASNIIKFFIQLLPVIILYIVFVFNGVEISPNAYLLLLPYLIIVVGLLGTALGLLLSALTIKYRDFTFIIPLLTQGLMYLCTVVYPLTSVTNETLKIVIKLNPVTWAVDTFRYACFGDGNVSFLGLGYLTVFTLLFLFWGVVVFNKTEKTFIDTI
jgi:lipopolysaccharide transport system permease protein